MAFSISTKPIRKGPRSHSTIHVATTRDYERKKLAAKHELKLEKDYDTLERKMISRAKWNQRAENKNLHQNSINNNSDHTTISLEDYIQREKIKQDNIINAKRMGNERIRRSSINTLPKT
jgi:beta-lactamase class D